MEIKFRKSTAMILSVSDILFPAQLYIAVCTVTESSYDLVCCRESLTKWAAGNLGRFRNGSANDICQLLDACI
jgi:hypothetical protein